MKNKKLNIILKCMLIILLAVGMLNIKTTAKAAEAATEIPVNDSWVEFTLTAIKPDGYGKIKLEKPGLLTLNITLERNDAGPYSTDYMLYQKEADVENNKVFNGNIMPSSTEIVTREKPEYLGKGEYFIKLHSYVNGSKNPVQNVKVKAKIEEAETDSKQENNSIDTALSLKPGKEIKGIFTYGNNGEKTEYYKFKLSKKSLIDIDFTSYMENVYFYILNSKNVQIGNLYIHSSGKVSEPKLANGNIVLNKGEYFIKLQAYKTGLFNFKLTTSPIIEKIRLTNLKSLKVGKEKKIRATITPGKVKNKKLKWTSSNEYVATVDEDGVVTGISAGIVRITAEATDGSGASAYRMVKIVDKK